MGGWTDGWMDEWVMHEHWTADHPRHTSPFVVVGGVVGIVGGGGVAVVVVVVTAAVDFAVADRLSSDPDVVAKVGTDATYELAPRAKVRSAAQAVHVWMALRERSTISPRRHHHHHPRRHRHNRRQQKQRQ